MPSLLNSGKQHKSETFFATYHKKLVDAHISAMMRGVLED